jgi:hypothetical protein
LGHSDAPVLEKKLSECVMAIVGQLWELLRRRALLHAIAPAAKMMGVGS